MGTYQLSGALTATAHAGILKTANTTALPIPQGISWGGKLEFYANAAQTIPSGTYNHLTLTDTDANNTYSRTVSSNVTWTLPSADGTNGQILQTNGSGTLSWVTNTGGSGISTGKAIAMSLIFGY